MEKYEANNFSVTNTGKTLLFEEWELIVDDEDEEVNIRKLGIYQLLGYFYRHKC